MRESLREIQRSGLKPKKARQVTPHPPIMPPGPTAERVKVIRAARAPLLVAIVAGLFLAFPPQTRESYRALDRQSLATCTLANAVVMAQLLRESSVPRARALRAGCCQFRPILCGGLIPACLSAGLYLAAHEVAIGAPPAETLEKMPELSVLVQALGASRANLIAAGVICTLIATSLWVPDRAHGLAGSFLVFFSAFR